MVSDRIDVRRLRGRIIGTLTAVVLLGLSACSTRDHLNPFDPDNPGTGGRPAWLTAMAANGRVDLSWTVDALDDLERMRLVRRLVDASGAATSEEVTLADPLPVGRTTWIDGGVENDSSYVYRLDYFFRGESGARAGAEVTATPGPRVIWLLDQSVGGPILLSADGRARRGAFGEGQPVDLSVDPRTGRAATVDNYDRRIEVFDPAGGRLASVITTGSPISLAWRPGDGSILVGSFDPSGVARWPAGLTATTENDTAFEAPIDLAWDEERGATWVADSERGVLIHRRSDGSRRVVEGFASPFSVAVDPPTGDCWMVDRRGQALYRVSAVADTVLARFEELAAPYMTISDGAGGAWLTDNGLDRVFRLDGQARVVAEVSGWGRPVAMARDPLTGDLWVTDSSRGELVRMAPDGSIRSRQGGFSAPFRIAVAVPGAGEATELRRRAAR